jgi:hypothetical protein
LHLIVSHCLHVELVLVFGAIAALESLYLLIALIHCFVGHHDQVLRGLLQILLSIDNHLLAEGVLSFLSF